MTKKHSHSIEFNLVDIKKAKMMEYFTNIDSNWFNDCETDFYKIISATTFFKFVSNSNTIFMSAKLSLKVRHMCSRCGEEFEEDIVENIFEEYENQQVIDVFPLIRETTILNQPIKILCMKCRKK